MNILENWGLTYDKGDLHEHVKELEFDLRQG